jgi:hypothetical protein
LLTPLRANMSFNPIYGQGMSVAALDAMALRDCLRRGVTDLPRRYFRETAKAIGVTWQTGATSDLAFAEVEGRRTPLMRVTNRLADLVLTACESDVVVGTRFFRVTGLLDPPTRLLNPSFLFRSPPSICAAGNVIRGLAKLRSPALSSGIARYHDSRTGAWQSGD